MKRLISLGAACLFASAGLAQQGQTQLSLEVSTDGVSWASSVAAAPSSVVLFRVVATWSGPPIVESFLSGNFQPSIDGWVGAGSQHDTLLPFADTGSNNTTPAGSVQDSTGLPSPGQEQNFFGRLWPYGGINITAANRLMGHLDSGGSILRIAQTPTTNPPGSGSGPNNVSGTGGVPFLKQAFVGPPPDPGPATSVVLLKLGVRISGASDQAERTLHLGIPIESLSLYGPNNAVRGVNWLVGYDPDTGAPITNYAAAVVFPAEIHVVPGVAVLPSTLLCGLLTVERRRRSQT